MAIEGITEISSGLWLQGFLAAAQVHPWRNA